MKGKHFSWITIWLIVVCVLLVVTGSYAAYSSVWYAKGVAVAKIDNGTVPFSSNYLTLCNTGDTIDGGKVDKMITASKQPPVSVAVTVCNYPQNDRSKFHATDIAYTLTATLLDADGKPLPGEITYQDEDGNPHTLSKNELIGRFYLDDNPFTTETITLTGQKLYGGIASLNSHALKCAEPALLNAVSIEMAAVPTSSCDDNCGLSAKKLLGLLKIVVVERNAQPWAGSFTDDLTYPSKVDAFNYVISGTAEETITLTWDENHVAPSKWTFADLPGSPPPPDNSNSITIHVGGEGNPTSYRLQFFRTTASPSGETKEAINGYVTLSRLTSTQAPEAEN